MAARIANGSGSINSKPSAAHVFRTQLDILPAEGCILRGACCFPAKKSTDGKRRTYEHASPEGAGLPKRGLK